MIIDETVAQWLNQVRFKIEPECMSVLQSKPILQRNLFHDPTQTGGELCQQASFISSRFLDLFRLVKEQKFSSIYTISMDIISRLLSLCDHIRSPDGVKIAELVERNSQKLRSFCIENRRKLGEEENERIYTNLLSNLDRIFHDLAQNIFQVHSRYLLDIISSSSVQMELLTAANELICLLSCNEFAGQFLAQCDCTKILLGRCCEYCQSEPDICAYLLRVVATACHNKESAQRLYDVGGLLEIVIGLLNDKTLSADLRSEAAGIIAQITAPDFIRYDHVALLIDYLHHLVESLTTLCMDADSAKAFLLTSAALANITTADSLASELLIQQNTVTILKDCIRRFQQNDILLAKDQVMTVLFNMSDEESCVNDLLSLNVVEFVNELLIERKRDRNDSKSTPRCSLNGNDNDAETERMIRRRMRQKASILLRRVDPRSNLRVSGNLATREMRSTEGVLV